jgi:hypothetical protein
MERLLNKLIGLLEHAAELYQSLFAVVQNDKNAVVDLDLQQLNEACKAKDNLLLKLRILEEQREQIMVRMADEIGCSPQGLTLTQLSLLVDESYARMQLIQGSYNLLSNLMAANPLYYRSGNVQKTDQTGKLLRGAV